LLNDSEFIDEKSYISIAIDSDEIVKSIGNKIITSKKNIIN
jgi:hypothetical protein